MKNVRKCPVCKQANLVLKTRQNNQGFYITCVGFPVCRNTYWLPPSVIDAQVSDNVCSQVFYFIFMKLLCFCLYNNIYINTNNIINFEYYFTEVFCNLFSVLEV